MDPVRTHHQSHWKGAEVKQHGAVKKLQGLHLVKVLHDFQVVR